MIVEIEKPRPSCLPSLEYNEGKVLRGVAELVAYANMDSVAREDIYSLFSRYERGVRYPTVERSFHASVNPSATDSCSEEQVLGFVATMMGHLGLGAQPYLVYRHFDIEREHYHVVSVRIRRDGSKINNYYEKRRVSAFMRENAPRFGFSMAEKGAHVQTAEDLAVGGKTRRSLRFDPRRGVAAQMKELYGKALTYGFDSFAQLSFVLEDLGLKVALSRSDRFPQITLQGLDGKGTPATEVFSEADLGEPLYERMSLAAVSGNKPRRFREKERVRSLVGFAFDISRSEAHFANILRNKGIHVHFSRTKESGDIFGVTFVDHTTRTVVKGSEIRDVVSVRRMQEAVASGKWRKEDRGRSRSSYVRRSRAAAREDSLRLRDLHVGAAARILRPVGQPVGASWNGKDKLSEDRRKARRDEGRAGAMDVNFEDRRYEEKIK